MLTQQIDIVESAKRIIFISPQIQEQPKEWTEFTQGDIRKTFYVAQNLEPLIKLVERHQGYYNAQNEYLRQMVNVLPGLTKLSFSQAILLFQGNLENFLGALINHPLSEEQLGLILSDLKISANFNIRTAPQELIEGYLEAWKTANPAKENEG